MSEKGLEGIERYFEGEDLSLPVKEWSEYRQRFVDLLPPRARVVDIGSNAGEDSHFFAEQGLNVVSGDIVPMKLQQAKAIGRKGQGVVIDINHLGLGESSVDGIWMANVFIFAEDENQGTILEECNKALRPSGKLFLCDNFFPSSEAEAFLIKKTGEYPFRSSYRVREMLDTTGFGILSEDIGVNIPGKAMFADKSGFYAVFAEKPNKKK